MKSLNDLRTQHGWFTFPEPEELRVAIDRIDRRLKRLMPESDLAGFKGRLIRAARLDLAGRALSAGEGYRRRVRSFAELTRPELAYTDSWLAQADLAQELTRLGWLPAPSPQRVARLLREDIDLPLRTRAKLIARYLSDDA